LECRNPLSITRDQIIQPITIRTVPPSQILEPIVRDSTRQTIIKPQLDASRAAEGILGISWDRLERGDGLCLQIIFAGPAATQFVVDGVLEEQPQIAVLSLETKKDLLRRIFVFSLVASLSGILLLILIIQFFPWGRSKDLKKPRWVYLIGGVFFAGLSLSFVALVTSELILTIQQPRLMPAKLITPGLEQELRKRQGSL
jgi:hypothetical protein